MKELPLNNRALTLAFGLLGIPAGVPAQAPEPHPPFQGAESLLMAADRATALKEYREGLLELAGRPPAERASPISMGEAELALHRLQETAVATAGLRAARPAFERWMDVEVATDPLVAALARFHAGGAALRAGGGLEEAERIWSSLGFLKGYRVAGPFDNERGGGFDTEYGPEADQRAAAAAGELFRADPEKSYPGKVRGVSFRDLPSPPVAGRVDLDELFRPNDEALAYALTHVESGIDQPAALRISSDDGYRAWVNGQPAASRDVRRPLGFDGDAVPIRLRKGWNSILFKVSESRGRWEFRARLTRPDGGPLPDWREGVPGAGAAGRQAEGGDPPPPASLGARDTLKRWIEGDSGGSGRAHYLLGAILLHARAHDEGEHPDRDLLRQAISLGRGPAPAVYHYTLGRASQRRTDIAAERDDNEWREAMELALASNPPSLRAGLDLAHYYFETFGNLSRARKLLEKVLEASPSLPEAVLLAARLDERQGVPAAVARAEEALKAAFTDTTRLTEAIDPLLARRVAQRLQSEGRLEAAEALLREVLARDRLHEEARDQLTDLHLSQGEGEEALALLAERERLVPFETATPRERARALEGLERPEEALQALTGASRIAPEDHQGLRVLGQALWKLGKKEEAFQVWDQALSIQPNFPELREQVEFLRKKRDEFAERYRRDARAAIASALERPLGGDEPVETLLDLTAARVNPDGTVKEFRQTIQRALNDRGIRMLGRHTTYYSSGEQRVEFKAAKVHHRDGRTEEARLSVHGGSGRESGGGDWSGASIDLPPVQAGDVVEVEHVTEDLRQSFFGDYFGRRERMGADYPTAERTFILETPAGRKLHFHQKNLELKPAVVSDDSAGTVTYTWTLRDVPSARPEPGMPPLEESEPVIDISTFASWDVFGRWYWNLIRHQFELSPQISAKVEELTSGRNAEADKIRAIYDFVTGEVRYNAWEFGVHGFKPYNAATIFQRRFGDCKDKATLICTMLGAAGIRAHPVLIRAVEGRGEEDLTMPMVNHFNHCIAYVPPSGNRPALYLDGTAERHAAHELPSMDRGARVLLVREGGGELAQVPWNDPAELGLEEEIQVAIEADRSARLKTRLRAKGDHAANLRAFFEVPGRRRIELEKIYGARFAGASVEEESFSPLSDRSRAVEIGVTVRVPALVARASEGEVIPPLEDLLETADDLGRQGALDERRHDLLLGPPSRSSLSVVYLLPAGYRVRSLPPPREVAGRFGKFTLRFEKTSEGGRPAVVMRRLIETTAPRVARADYPEFRRLAAQAASIKDEKILIEKAP